MARGQAHTIISAAGVGLQVTQRGLDIASEPGKAHRRSLGCWFIRAAKTSRVVIGRAFGDEQPNLMRADWKRHKVEEGGNRPEQLTWFLDSNLVSAACGRSRIRDPLR